MEPLRVLPSSSHSSAVGYIVASVAAHGGLFASLLALAAAPDPTAESVFPPLYFYAPDRQPAGLHTRDEVLPNFRGGPLGGRSSRRIGADGDAQLSPATDTGVRRGYGANGLLAPSIPSLLLDSVYSVVEVDSAVARVDGSVAPEYPPDLLQQGVEGEVETEFVVDTTGRVDSASVKVIWSSHRDFTESVEHALGEMLFRPAMRGRHRVRQLVQQRFRFKVAAPVAAGAT